MPNDSTTDRKCPCGCGRVPKPGRTYAGRECWSRTVDRDVHRTNGRGGVQPLMTVREYYELTKGEL